MELYTFVNAREQNLKSALQYYCTGLSGLDISRALKNKDVKVNGVRQKDDECALAIGDKVEIYFVPHKYYEVVYDDDNILVVNKIYGIETNSEDQNKQTLVKEINKTFPNAVPVHRLDTNTLGLVCFAQNSTAEEVLLEAFRSGGVIKKYIAKVSSENIKQQQNFVDSFVKDSKSGIVRFGQAKNDGFDARLQYELLDLNGDLATILVTLHTGKTHQIRAQLAYHKIYILGDGKYGDKNLNRKYKKSQQELKSVYLQFVNLQNFKYLQNLQFSLI